MTFNLILKHFKNLLILNDFIHLIILLNNFKLNPRNMINTTLNGFIIFIKFDLCIFKIFILTI